VSEFIGALLSSLDATLVKSLRDGESLGDVSIAAVLSIVGEKELFRDWMSCLKSHLIA
jgi:hypothetical protein